MYIGSLFRTFHCIKNGVGIIKNEKSKDYCKADLRQRVLMGQYRSIPSLGIYKIKILERNRDLTVTHLLRKEFLTFKNVLSSWNIAKGVIWSREMHALLFLACPRRSDSRAQVKKNFFPCFSRAGLTRSPPSELLAPLSERLERVIAIQMIRALHLKLFQIALIPYFRGNMPSRVS